MDQHPKLRPYTVKTYYLFVLLLIGCECTSTCNAQVVSVRIKSKESTGLGSAFYVGKTEEGTSVFVTARHLFEEGYVSGLVSIKGSDYPIVGEPTLDEEEDVAVFESTVQLKKGILLFDDAHTGEELELPGYGPTFKGQTEGIKVRKGIVTSSTSARMSDGLIIEGDSGCPAMSSSGAIGVVVGYETYNRTATVIVPTRYIKRCLRRRYVEVQCGPSGCPIYMRPRVEQPVIGFGIPVGPPRFYNEAVPVPQAPQVYVPRPQSQQPIQVIPQPQPQVMQGPKGDKGEPGPKGEPGLSVSQAQVESVVNAWLDSNIEQLRGERGPKGDSGDTANVAELERRVSSIEKRKFRIQIRNGDKVVDDETFLLSEMERDPVILDINKLRTSSGN